MPGPFDQQQPSTRKTEQRLSALEESMKAAQAKGTAASGAMSSTDVDIKKLKDQIAASALCCQNATNRINQLEQELRALQQIVQDLIDSLSIQDISTESEQSITTEAGDHIVTESSITT